MNEINNKEKNKLAGWFKAHKFAGVGIAVTLTIVLIAAIALPVSTVISNNSALSSAQAAADSFDEAKKENKDSNLALNKIIEDSTVIGDNFTAVIGSTSGMLSEELSAKITSDSATLTDVLGNASAYTKPSISIARLPLDGNTVDYEKFVDDANKAESKLDKNTVKVNKNIKFIDSATTAVDNDMSDITEALVDSFKQFNDANPSAGVAEKAAYEAAVNNLKTDDGKNTVDLINAYVTTFTAVKVSHAAVEAQKVIDAATEAGAETYVDPGTGEVRSNPNYNSDNSGGGGDGGYSDGNSGGGNSGGNGGGNSGGGSDGNSGGGGGGASNPPMMISSSGSACQGTGGSQSVTYGSTLMPPYNAINISTYEIPGYGYGVDWSCDTGW